MIDLHTHLLPNIDDGASSLKEALEMTESLYAQGIRKAACTPHFDPTKSSLQEFVMKRTFAMDCMNASKVALLSGSETVLDDYLFHYPNLSELCIEHTRYLLLELPFGIKWDKYVYEKTKQLLTYYEVIPIIAHIERYESVIKSVKCIQKLIELGCVIQLNTSSIIDRKSRHQALQYIKHGYIDVLGSDCHNMTRRPPVIVDALDIIIQSLGTKYCEEFKHNAECIVNGICLREKISYII